jgi:hypothetical protein
VWFKITLDDLKFQHYCYVNFICFVHGVSFCIFVWKCWIWYCFLCKWVIILVLTWCTNPKKFMLCFICVMMVIVVNVNIGMHDMFVLHFLFLILCKWGWTLLHFLIVLLCRRGSHYNNSFWRLYIYCCLLLCFLV